MTRTAILVAQESAESAALCEAAGYSIVGTIRDRLAGPRYGVSDRTAESLQGMVESSDPDVVIYDELLRPEQNYNLASRLQKSILDREALILEIFELRASSAESKLQVRLAQLRYEMGRARERVRLAKRGEQPGFMGIGKFGVDAYHDDIKHRMQAVRKKLSKSGRQRELHRRSRKRQGFATVSLAGYTSAGKTTIFNALSGENKDQGEELFTTLSTTVRRLDMARPVLLSDTVGFISKLPAYMIEAFRSTLEELSYADVVIVVFDASDDEKTIRKKLRSCHSALRDLDVPDGRILYAVNKIDVAERAAQKTADAGLDARRCVAVSGRTGAGLDRLLDMIKGMFEDGR